MQHKTKSHSLDASRHPSTYLLQEKKNYFHVPLKLWILMKDVIITYYLHLHIISSNLKKKKKITALQEMLATVQILQNSSCL